MIVWHGRRASMLVPRVLVAIACLTGTARLMAQTDRGRIEGIVTDSSGASVVGARIQVINTGTNSQLDFQANEFGIYLAPNLPVGTYRLVVQKEGFTTAVREPILVRAQSSLKVD